MVTNDIETKIIEFLKDHTDELHSSQLKPIVYCVYGGEKINKDNLRTYEKEIFGILCKLEKDGIIKNTNRQPEGSPYQITGSRWILLTKLRN